MKVSLIITTYNRPDALEVVLFNAIRQSFMDFEIVIADDGSSDNTRRVIENYQQKSYIDIIHSFQKDMGFRAAMARNRAVAKSQGDYLIFIDGDIVIHKDFIADHLQVAEKETFIQGGRVFLDKTLTEEFIRNGEVNINPLHTGVENRKNLIRSKFLSNIFSKYDKSLRGIKSCNFALFKDDFLEVNGFDNRFVGWGREDSELANRLLNRGIKRKNLKFLATAYHLYHEESSRESLPENNKILEESINKKLVWCKDGVNRFYR
jgi:glycosyltransferase involved in cell wall biosynthesis